jgi:hypothetical protein
MVVGLPQWAIRLKMPYVTFAPNYKPSNHIAHLTIFVT